MKPTALTIAGSDPSGGAGLQADLKTFHQRGVYGMSVITLLTVQNTRAVKKVVVLDPAFVISQLETVLEDLPCGAAKTGALGSRDVVAALGRFLKKKSFPLVVDPVMISKHGLPLLAAEAYGELRRSLLPLATLVTPNLPEAEAICGFAVTDLELMEKAARKIASFGARSVLIKGGHLDGEASDLLLDRGRVEIFKSGRVSTPHTHGTGCTFSAAITAELAKGLSLAESVRVAKRFIARAIETGPGLGGGRGPVNHHARIRADVSMSGRRSVKQ